jgi:hypothetical protein
MLIAAGSALVAVGMCSGPAWGRDARRSALPSTKVNAVALSEAQVTTIATGLDNPRDIAIANWGGGVFVAEAGHGADHGSTECVPGGEGEEPTCVGFTGGVSRITSFGQHRVLSGMVSLAEPSGFAALGLSGVDSSWWGNFAVIDESAAGIPPEASKFVTPETFNKVKAQLGRLIAFSETGTFRTVADVGDFDHKWTGEHKSLVPEQFPDANPYAVMHSGQSTYVIDAAANTLDRVSSVGNVSVEAFFPNPPVSDAVPTCIDRGPDGAFYVSNLGGAGNAAGASSVWRVVPGQAPTVWATGLTSVNGCGFGADGQFYAVELSTKNLIEAEPGTGAVVRVAPHSTSPTPIVEHLSFPAGFAAAKDGSLYVSNWGIAPANSGGGPTGEVLKITLPG